MVHHDYSFTNKHACFSSYEVQPAPKKKATTADNDEDNDADDGQQAPGEQSGSTDVMDSAWFVPANREADYRIAWAFFAEQAEGN